MQIFKKNSLFFQGVCTWELYKVLTSSVYPYSFLLFFTIFLPCVSPLCVSVVSLCGDFDFVCPPLFSVSGVGAFLCPGDGAVLSKKESARMRKEEAKEKKRKEKEAKMRKKESEKREKEKGRKKERIEKEMEHAMRHLLERLNLRLREDVVFSQVRLIGCLEVLIG